MYRVGRLSFALRLLATVVFAVVAAFAVQASPAGVASDEEFDLADVGVSAASAPNTTSAPPGTAAPATTVPAEAPEAPAAPAASPVVAAPTTTAAAPPATTAAPSLHERGAAALALVPFPVEQTGYELIFEGHRDGYLGLTSTVNKTITIYIRPSQTTREIAKVIAHEVGHAVDVEFTSETERLLYRQIRGIDGRSWYPDCSGCTDYDSPAGDFAETFAMAMVGDVNFLSTVAAPPTPSQIRALAAIFTI
jgi:hypothetical protein